MNKLVGSWEIVDGNKMGEIEGSTVKELRIELARIIKIYAVDGCKGSWAIYTNDDAFNCIAHGFTRTKK